MSLQERSERCRDKEMDRERDRERDREIRDILEEIERLRAAVAELRRMDFVLLGPRVSQRFQNSENAYMRPQITGRSDLHRRGAMELLFDATGVLDGVRVRRKGVYDLRVSAFLQVFPDAISTTPIPFQGTQDVRAFINDPVLTFPSSPYGQSVQFSTPTLLNNTQDPSVGYATKIPLNAGDTITFGFLYVNAGAPGLYYVLAFLWSVSLVSTQCRDVENREMSALAGF
jgi:hypothetical protein